MQSMDTMLTLLKEAWHMEAPNLLISVTGGAKNFKMLPRLKEMFRRGLINVAKSTGNTTCPLATRALCRIKLLPVTHVLVDTYI